MQRFNLFIVCAIICFFSACGGSNTDSNNATATDSLTVNQEDTANATGKNAATLLKMAQPSLEGEFNKWAQSFSNFHIDSFQFSQKGSFEQIDYEASSDINTFYSLYKPSLIYSSDSSWFIDLYSAGISLEKKGKKIIAIGDVDQAITLCNLKTKDWKRIAFFGPSAGIEEAAWLSTSQFVLAGMMHNDEGKSSPILLFGDVNEKSFYWFEAKIIRKESSNYIPGPMNKLKIDEWE
jgi:hypothetical protein